MFSDVEVLNLHRLKDPQYTLVLRPVLAWLLWVLCIGKSIGLVHSSNAAVIRAATMAFDVGTELAIFVDTLYLHQCTGNVATISVGLLVNTSTRSVGIALNMPLLIRSSTT